MSQAANITLNSLSDTVIRLEMTKKNKLPRKNRSPAKEWKWNDYWLHQKENQKKNYPLLAVVFQAKVPSKS